jgi:hypothetical protein
MLRFEIFLCKRLEKYIFLFAMMATVGVCPEKIDDRQDKFAVSRIFLVYPFQFILHERHGPLNEPVFYH